MAKEKKKKIWKYSPFHSFKFEDKEHSMTSQVYQTGIYAIYNNDPAQQTGFVNPEGIIKLQNRLRKGLEEKKITDLYFSPAIRITEDKDGFLIQLPNE